MTDNAEDLVVQLSDHEKRLNRYRTLELNADGQPMSYYPLSTMTWQEIMFLVVKGELTGIPRINILAEYEDDDAVVRTSIREFRLPSVISHLEFIKRPDTVAFTKFNVFLRDDFTCQYSGEKHDPVDLTFDHIVPQCRGGKTNWLNIVTAHRSVNELKDSMSLKEFQKRTGLYLRRQPYEPQPYEMLNKGKKYPPKYLHESWQDYLYWDSELES